MDSYTMLSPAQLLGAREDDGKACREWVHQLGRTHPWGVFNCRHIRRSSTRMFEPAAAQFREQIDSAMRCKRPLRFVVIEYSFKCGRPHRTDRKTPDAGEWWSLAQLCYIADAVKEVYPPGATFCVLTEGEVLAPLLGISRTEEQQYRARLEKFARMLQAPVAFASLKEVAEETPRFSWEFERRLQHRPLARAKGNLIPYLDGQNVRDPSVACALEAYHYYRAFRAAFKATCAIQRRFPDAIQISTVALFGEFAYWAIERGCCLLPHRGVPVLTRSGRRRIVPLSDLDKRAVPVHLMGDVEAKPFYYKLV